MNIEGQIEGLEKKVMSLIENEPEVFLVDVRIKPTNNVKIFLDADSGLSIERLVQYNRRLYKYLEETGSARARAALNPLQFESIPSWAGCAGPDRRGRSSPFPCGRNIPRR